MDLSPNDIRNYEFPTQLRGYDKDEVDAFVDKVAQALEQLKEENLKIKTELESASSQLAGLRQFEETIKSAAIDARRNADMTIANAKKEAELALTKAKANAEKLVVAHQQRVNVLENQIEQLRLTKNSYLAKIKQMINNHLQLVEEVADSEKIDAEVKEKLENAQSAEVKDKLEITQSAEVKANKTQDTSEIKVPTGSTDNDSDNDNDNGKPVEDAKTLTDDEPAETDFAADQKTDEEETPSEEMSQELASAIKDEDSNSEEKIDPELAAALQNYQKDVNQSQEQEPAETSATEFVETTSRAEDIPDGFVAVGESDESGSSPDSTEHNSISIDEDVSAPNPNDTDPIDPDNLSQELDEVAAKFAEELDKAESAKE